jgi:hypothetical protein
MSNIIPVKGKTFRNIQPILLLIVNSLFFSIKRNRIIVTKKAITPIPATNIPAM